MADFVTRVELHGATGEDYNKLHGFMEAVHFRRWISDANGVRYALPTATYHSVSYQLDVEGVRGLARNAAAKTNKSFWVITTQGQSAWLTKRL